MSEAFGLRGWLSTMRARLGARALVRGDVAWAIEHYRTAVDLARELALPSAETTPSKGLPPPSSAPAITRRRNAPVRTHVPS